MKIKSKQHSKQLQGHIKPIFLDFNREKISEMEISLRKILSNPMSFTINQYTIQNLIKLTKQVLKIMQMIKSQSRHYQTIQQNYNMIQSKLQNHDKIINNLQQLHSQRQKSLLDENRNIKEYFEKNKKNIQESEEIIKNKYQEIKKDNLQLKSLNQILNQEKISLLKTIQEKETTIKELQEHNQKFIKVSKGFIEADPQYNQPFLSAILRSSLCHRVVVYLSPADITNLELLNSECRIYLTKSKKVQNCLSKNIIKVKNRQIAYYHKHINYFEHLYQKIPEQILHFTFYRYQILKENIGTQMLNILNSSANLFEGKFTDGDEKEEKGKDQQRDIDMQNNASLQTVTIGGITLNIEKQIRNVRDFNNETPSNVLEVNEDIVREFLEDRRNSQQKINEQINLMYRKIQQSAQLYSADVQTIGLFLKNILKNFSKVFVLSKTLYTEARNLQSLNTLILRQLSNWNKIQVQKNSQIQDLKAQLEAQKKLRIFFTDKNINSEQRALNQQNKKLGFQSKLAKQTEKFNAVCKEKEELSGKLNQCKKDLKNLKSDNKQLRKAYENGKEKYNKIIEELSVVKQTILRMNIM